MRRTIGPALVVLALSGCVNMAPDHERPALATANAYAPQLRPDGTVVAASLSYREWFSDPRLVALVDTALTQNRDLLAATARIEQARAQYRIQDSRRLPTPVANAAASRSRTPLATVAPGASGSTTADRFEVGVGVSSFELDFWGRIANLSDAARAQYLAAEANQRAFYLSLIADVASTYFALLEAGEQIDLAQATLESRQAGPDCLWRHRKTASCSAQACLPILCMSVPMLSQPKNSFALPAPISARREPLSFPASR